MYKIEERQLSLVHQHVLSKDEDAPMTLAINHKTKQLAAGINSSVDRLNKGINENLRLFSYSDDSITFQQALQTLASADEDQYQKVTAFNNRAPSSKPVMVAVGSTDSQISLIELPSMDDVWPSVQYEGEEIFDVDFNDSGDMVSAADAYFCPFGMRVLIRTAKVDRDLGETVVCLANQGARTRRQAPAIADH